MTPQTVLHFSPYMLNRHPEVWDRPDEFDPDRWLSEESSNLEKYMASFNRGARQCLGKECVPVQVPFSRFCTWKC